MTPKDWLIDRVHSRSPWLSSRYRTHSLPTSNSGSKFDHRPTTTTTTMDPFVNQRTIQVNDQLNSVQNSSVRHARLHHPAHSALDVSQVERTHHPLLVQLLCPSSPRRDRPRLNRLLASTNRTKFVSLMTTIVRLDVLLDQSHFQLVRRRKRTDFASWGRRLVQDLVE